MNYCKLCTDKIADKKGSHIVPHFLLKRIENIDGKKGRDYELGFSIGEFETESHFGRAVSPEKLEQIFGEMEENEYSNEHPLVVDHIFCNSCEKKLSIIESEYSKTLDKKMILSEIGILFWMSVIWRMSINKNSGVQLSSGENEIARRILHRYLKEDIANMDFDSMREAHDFKKISYKIIRCPEYSLNSSTYLIIHPHYRKPYSLIIDEFIILFSFKNNYDQYKQKGIFGFHEDNSNIETNIANSGNERVYNITNECMSNINKTLIETIKDRRLKKINEYLNLVHKTLGGKGSSMPDEIRKQIMQKVTSTEKKEGRKYTIADLNNSTYEVLKKYALIENEK